MGRRRAGTRLQPPPPQGPRGRCPLPLHLRKSISRKRCRNCCEEPGVSRGRPGSEAPAWGRVPSRWLTARASRGLFRPWGPAAWASESTLHGSLSATAPPSKLNPQCVWSQRTACLGLWAHLGCPSPLPCPSVGWSRSSSEVRTNQRSSQLNLLQTLTPIKIYGHFPPPSPPCDPQHQLGVLPSSSALTLSSWRQHHFP